MDWWRVRWAELRAGWMLPGRAATVAWVAIALCGVLILVVGLAAKVVAARAAPIVRTRLLAMLQSQLGPQVRVGDVHTHFNGGLRIDVDGVEAASVQSGVPGDPARPMLHIDHVQADLGPLAALMGSFLGRSTTTAEGGTAMQAGTPARTAWGMKEAMAHLSQVTLEGVHLRFDNGGSGRAALQFDLPHVVLTGLDRLGSKGTFDYRATVDAGAPVGQVETQGTMGPWNAGDPRATPLAGTFEFSKRNVGSRAQGMSGMLSMQAKYAGTLSRLETEGTTDDPMFGLSVSAHTVELKTAFKMQIDAAHDQVTMETLDARFLRTHFVVSGTVTKTPASGGYALDFLLNVPQGRVEDALTLGAGTQPPLLRGSLTMTGRLLLPAGEAPVARRLQLRDGRFELTGAQFGKASVQKSADALSEKAEGHPGRANAEEAAPSSARVTGGVALEAGVMQLTGVRLVAPGVALALAGHYMLGGGGFDMRGTLHTDATASEMSTGWTKMLARPLNGLFGHGRAGTTLPLQVTGSGNEPHFTVTMPGGKTMSALN